MQDLRHVFDGDVHVGLRAQRVVRQWPVVLPQHGSVLPEDDHVGPGVRNELDEQRVWPRPPLVVQRAAVRPNERYNLAAKHKPMSREQFPFRTSFQHVL